MKPQNRKEQERNSLYNYKWQKFRELFLKKNPLCVFCKRQGIITRAVVVDHIKPHRGCTALFWNNDNLQSLCKLHHDSTKQAMEKGTDKPLINTDGWPV